MEYNYGSVNFFLIAMGNAKRGKEGLHLIIPLIIHIFSCLTSCYYSESRFPYFLLLNTSWFCENNTFRGFQRASVSSLQLQLAPSLEHQIAAMLSILERYKWHQFSIVTSQIAGHDDFIQAVRERITEMQDRFK